MPHSTKIIAESWLVEDRAPASSVIQAYTHFGIGVVVVVTKRTQINLRNGPPGFAINIRVL